MSLMRHVAADFRDVERRAARPRPRHDAAARGIGDAPERAAFGGPELARVLIRRRRHDDRRHEVADGVVSERTHSPIAEARIAIATDRGDEADVRK
jgi:hypothetical protein